MSPTERLLLNTMTELALACFVKRAESRTSDFSLPIQGIKPVKPISTPSWYRRMTANKGVGASNGQSIANPSSVLVRNPSAEMYAVNHNVSPELLYTDQGKAFDQLIRYLIQDHAKKG